MNGCTGGCSKQATIPYVQLPARDGDQRPHRTHRIAINRLNVLMIHPSSSCLSSLNFRQPSKSHIDVVTRSPECIYLALKLPILCRARLSYVMITPGNRPPPLVARGGWMNVDDRSSLSDLQVTCGSIADLSSELYRRIELIICIQSSHLSCRPSIYNRTNNDHRPISS